MYCTACVAWGTHSRVRGASKIGRGREEHLQ
jgi:hypothetical protein